MKKLYVMSICATAMSVLYIIITSIFTFSNSVQKFNNSLPIVIILIFECIILVLEFYYYILSKPEKSKPLFEKFCTLVSHFDGVIWEYDINTDILKKSDKNGGLDLGSDCIQNYSTYYIDNNIIYPEDLKKYKQFCHQLRSGKKEIHCIFRAKDITGEFVWFEIVGITIFKKNIPISVVGSTTNIDKKQKEYQKLKQHAEEDPLTKLYNRATAESKINSIIESSESKDIHAFCMIDIDNFKSLNDNLGHAFGDAVLVEFSTKLKYSIPLNDFAFRVGGDEFAVFLTNIPSNSYAENISRKICSLFKELSMSDNKLCNISGSIGVSLYPDHGANFDELFEKADIALYHSKNLGKDCFTMYSKKTMGEISVSSQKVKKVRKSS